MSQGQSGQEKQQAPTAEAPIFIKRVKKHAHGHHGGAWKIAYADFVTAMMAFFLLMWLLVSVKKETLQGISEYFKMPLRIALRGGESIGDRTSVIKGGGQDLSKRDGQMKKGDVAAEQVEKPVDKKPIQVETPPMPPPINVDMKDDKTRLVEAKEMLRLSELKAQFEKAIEANPNIKQYKSQLKLEVTSKGLRIQILDEQNRPMFATGSAELEPYMKEIIREIAKVLNEVPNKISIAGHTDATPYFTGEKSYSNWELSADRANASRRELIAAGIDEKKMIRVVGFASSIPLDLRNPQSSSNRRISIMVLNKKSEEETLKEGF